ncbi:hypothetical protein P3T33_004601 [Rhizobium sp. AN67]|nr:hypothetical protein [Rhizobium sp. AN67]SOD50306.1 Autoinducer synthase [Rhizobium sp. AN6A]
MRILTVPRDQHQSDELAQMHRLRVIGFRDRLERGVTTSESGEFDQRDQLDPTNIRAVANDNRVVVCARRLPAVGRTMLQRALPQLLASGSFNATYRMIESFCVCIDTSFPGRGGGQFHLHSTDRVRFHHRVVDGEWLRSDCHGKRSRLRMHPEPAPLADNTARRAGRDRQYDCDLRHSSYRSSEFRTGLPAGLSFDHFRQWRGPCRRHNFRSSPATYDKPNGASHLGAGKDEER